MQVLIAYYSRTGNTAAMAELVAEGVEEVSGVEPLVKKVEEVTLQDLLAAEGIILGSPTYYGAAARQIKKLIDRSNKHHGKLEGKVGGAFTSAMNVGGGNETALLNMLCMLLVHGLIIPGFSKGDHYGPVALEAPDERAAENCRRLGQRVAELVRKLA